MPTGWGEFRMLAERLEGEQFLRVYGCWRDSRPATSPACSLPYGQVQGRVPGLNAGAESE